ncbi:Predicted secreted protein [Seinonella peptonophila]|uniref:Predicted secreted protein n=1 Tax=Seinonella peptonophila TaxID=112248 RepID=A0A1M5B9U3_9BACL|nr:CD3072 family TudS-related putative desulfidase [Seinonella peptonophila]SHF39331.1 Predicted secreted protein [Seinonella peptonophila]
MQRSQKIIVTSHCILNQNAVVRSLARSTGIMKSAVDWCHEQGYGIVQLPCPEFTFLGPERPPMSKEEYDTTEFRQHCRKILLPVIEQLKIYQRHGYELVGGISIADSPSCDSGNGVFMDEFRSLVIEHQIELNHFWQIPNSEDGYFDPNDEKSIYGSIKE